MGPESEEAMAGGAGAGSSVQIHMEKMYTSYKIFIWSTEVLLVKYMALNPHTSTCILMAVKVAATDSSRDKLQR